MKNYRLHYAPDNASLIIRIALEELGLSFETILVDRAAKAQLAEAYLRLNPNGLIPVLETPDGPIFETGAILLWLTDRHGGLGPQIGDPKRTAFVKWLFFLSNTVHPALRMQFYPWCYVGEDRAAQKALLEQTAHDLVRHFSTLNDRAAREDKTVGGSSPNGVDIYIAAALRWLQLYPVDRANTHIFAAKNWGHLFDVCQRLEIRPSVAALCKAEGMDARPFTCPMPPNPPEGSTQ